MYFKTKIFPVLLIILIKFKVLILIFKLYWRRPGRKRMLSFGVRKC